MIINVDCREVARCTDTYSQLIAHKLEKITQTVCVCMCVLPKTKTEGDGKTNSSL